MDLKLGQCSKGIKIRVEKSTPLPVSAYVVIFTGKPKLSPPVTIEPASQDCEIHRCHMLVSGREAADKVHPKRHEFPRQAGDRRGRKYQ